METTNWEKNALTILIFFQRASLYQTTIFYIMIWIEGKLFLKFPLYWINWSTCTEFIEILVAIIVKSGLPKILVSWTDHKDWTSLLSFRIKPVPLITMDKVWYCRVTRWRIAPRLVRLALPFSIESGYHARVERGSPITLVLITILDLKLLSDRSKLCRFILTA